MGLLTKRSYVKSQIEPMASRVRALPDRANPTISKQNRPIEGGQVQVRVQTIKQNHSDDTEPRSSQPMG